MLRIADNTNNHSGIEFPHPVVFRSNSVDIYSWHGIRRNTSGVEVYENLGPFIVICNYTGAYVFNTIKLFYRTTIDKLEIVDRFRLYVFPYLTPLVENLESTIHTNFLISNQFTYDDCSSHEMFSYEILYSYVLMHQFDPQQHLLDVNERTLAYSDDDSNENTQID